MKFTEYLKNNIILFDGAMGTEIQKLEVQDNEWGGYTGCNEMLTLGAPHHIAGIHRSYLEAGADVIETNTFGANRIVLSDYHLEDRTREINRAAAQIAVDTRDAFVKETSRAAPPEADIRDAFVKEKTVGTSAGPAKQPRFVAGSIGPGTRLPSLGQVDFDTIHFSYLEQARGLIEGGVDLFIIETCQDVLQIKSAVIAVKDALKEADTDLPIIVSITVEHNGSLLVGSDIPSVVIALVPLGVEIIGINCATGPTEMRPHIEELHSSFDGTLFCMPNAGFPVQRGGSLVYDLPPKEFADILTSFVIDFGVDIIGGCCGSDPAFIAELRSRISALRKPDGGKSSRQAEAVPALSSLYSRQELRQEPAPFFVGERINSNGSKLFRTHLLEEDWDAVTAMGLQQLKTGAHGIDVCAAYAGRDERRDMVEIVRRLTTHIDLPLVIDSTSPEVIEAALKLTGGRSLINSVNLENGEEHADRLFSLARRYGAAIIALTIDEQGMARRLDRKLEIARRLYDSAVKKHGLSPSDLVIDPLTFTLGSGDPELRDAGWQTIEALSAIKRELPGVHTILGVSNISYGLSPHSREILNSVFLSEAIQAGLDMAIVNVHKIIPVYQLSSREKQLALHLIYNRGQSDPLLSYIDFFSKKSSSPTEAKAKHFAALKPGEQVRELILEGTKSGLTDLLDTMLQTIPASNIISDHLIPAMKRVGELFGEGSMQLPFVLQSAEVMKKAVDYLEPFLERHEDGPGKKIVLATVRGDVHDIGKNLVDIILSNNGYTVFNLGIKVDIETIIEKALEVDADAVGMSGLLVKSTQVMKANLQEMRRRDIHLPVLLGGAALTEQFVREECAPLLNAPVYYCRDAFEGLQALDRTAEAQASSAGSHPFNERPAGKVSDTRSGVIAPAAGKAVGIDVHDGTAAYRVPRLQSEAYELHTLSEIDVPVLFDMINRSRLFRSRWKYRQGAESRDAYAELEKKELIPLFAGLREKVIGGGFLQPRVSFRFFPCRSSGEELNLFESGGGKAASFHFPRQSGSPFKSVADFFLSESGPQDNLVALQIVTLGPQIGMEIQRLFREDNYREYLHLHGLAVELTEALAGYAQVKVEELLEIEQPSASVNALVGTRYSFGYPCCPDLSTNRTIADLLDASRLGITFTEDDQMVPEFSTSAFICFNPAAEYI